MTFDLADARAVLSRTPRTLDALLRGLPGAWLACDEGADTWSPFDVVGHLLHGEETDWLPRLAILLEHGEARPFEPFDRFAMLEKSRGKTMAEILDRFAALRRQGLDRLDALALRPEQLGRTGRHPELGVVTLGELLATWVVHDLGHIAQVTRVMAKRYRDDVGPWRAYLPVLDR
jgi:hypothetical protein